MCRQKTRGLCLSGATRWLLNEERRSHTHRKESSSAGKQGVLTQKLCLRAATAKDRNWVRLSFTPTQSAEALPAALGDLLGGVDGVGNKSTLDSFPAVLDLDVTIPHQFEDVPRQIHKCLKIRSRALQVSYHDIVKPSVSLQTRFRLF